MPNRILKESICSSENIELLTAFQETFFYRLIVNVDDFGRMDARPKILASKLFPLKDVRLSHISDALRALATAKLVTLYEVDGKPFLQLTTWDKHQRIRTHKGKYPALEDGSEMESDDNLQQLAADCSRLQQLAADCSNLRPESNPIQSNTNPNPNPNPNPTRAREDAQTRFEDFWSAYPRHEAKQKAKAAFLKINPDDELLHTMRKSIEAWKKTEQWTENGGQFIPHPTTWLNGRRWEDEVPSAKTGAAKPAKTVIAQQYSQRSYADDEDIDAIYERLGLRAYD